MVVNTHSDSRRVKIPENLRTLFLIEQLQAMQEGLPDICQRLIAHSLRLALLASDRLTAQQQEKVPRIAHIIDSAYRQANAICTQAEKVARIRCRSVKTTLPEAMPETLKSLLPHFVWLVGGAAHLGVDINSSLVTESRQSLIRSFGWGENGFNVKGGKFVETYQALLKLGADRLCQEVANITADEPILSERGRELLDFNSVLEMSLPSTLLAEISPGFHQGLCSRKRLSFLVYKISKKLLSIREAAAEYLGEQLFAEISDDSPLYPEGMKEVRGLLPKVRVILDDEARFVFALSYPKQLSSFVMARLRSFDTFLELCREIVELDSGELLSKVENIGNNLLERRITLSFLSSAFSDGHRPNSASRMTGVERIEYFNPALLEDSISATLNTQKVLGCLIYIPGFYLASRPIVDKVRCLMPAIKRLVAANSCLQGGCLVLSEKYEQDPTAGFLCLAGSTEAAQKAAGLPNDMVNILDNCRVPYLREIFDYRADISLSLPLSLLVLCNGKLRAEEIEALAGLLSKHRSS